MSALPWGWSVLSFLVCKPAAAALALLSVFSGFVSGVGSGFGGSGRRSIGFSRIWMSPLSALTRTNLTGRLIMQQRRLKELDGLNGGICKASRCCVLGSILQSATYAYGTRGDKR